MAIDILEMKRAIDAARTAAVRLDDAGADDLAIIVDSVVDAALARYKAAGGTAFDDED